MEVKSIKGKKLNKGEWAEFYVMLKLLGEGRLYTADKFLKKNLKSYLDILKVIREECNSNVLEYILSNDVVTIKEQKTSNILASYPAKDFLDNATTLFNGIKNLKGMAVEAPESVCDFAKVIFVSKPKAPSVKALKKQFGGKNDIFVEVRDGHTSIVSVMGFSIKSKFGSNPTLFNAGSSSQLIYELNNCNDELMTKFNSITDDKGKRAWGKCKAFLSENKIDLIYIKPKNNIYKSNLSMITESMDILLSECFKERLIYQTKGTLDYNVKETTERIIAKDPLAKNNKDMWYEKFIKDFLMASFTGMTASVLWDGKEQVSGGYIVVMEDGEVLCYHSNDREGFRDYLYKNTHFEYVDCKKYHWSLIIKKDNKYYLPLNASVRFNTNTR